MFKPEFTPLECYTNSITLGEREHDEQGTLFYWKLRLCIENYWSVSKIDNEAIENTGTEVLVDTKKIAEKVAENIVISILKNEYS